MMPAAAAGLAAVTAWLRGRGGEAVGGALVHFVWQAGLVAAVLAAAQPRLQRASARARYGWSCVALFALPVVFAATAAWEWRGPGWAPADVSRWMAGRLAAWLPWIVLAWGLGVAVLAARTLGGWLWLQRIRRGVDRQVPEAWRQTLARLRRRLGLGTEPGLGVTALVTGPCVVGWWRPLVLLPLGTLAGTAPESLEALLAHELAHIRRHDYLVNLAQRGVQALFFFHPAVHWLSRQVEQEREHCCDDAAIAVCGDRMGYARALLELADGRAPGVACAATGGALRRRIERIVMPPGTAPGAPAGGRRGVLALALVLALGFGLMSAGTLRAAERRMAGATVTAAPERPAPRLEAVAMRVPLLPAPGPAVAKAVAPRPVAAGSGAAVTPQVAAAPQAPVAHRPPPQLVTVTFAAYSSCEPEWVWVRHVAPTGETWMGLEPVLRCVPVIQPTGVWVSTL